MFKIYSPLCQLTSIVECLSLKLCSNNPLVKCLNDKVINVDLKCILLEKPVSEVGIKIKFIIYFMTILYFMQLEQGEIIRINAQINGLSFILESKLQDKIIAEPFDFNSLQVPLVISLF